MIKGVFFHFDTLKVPQYHAKRQELETFLQYLKEHDIKTAVLSTKKIKANEALAELGLPPVDFEVTRLDIGKGKGSPDWVHKTCEMMGISPHESLYIGGGIQDWRTAINTPVFYIQGEWQSRMALGVTSLTTTSPLEVISLMEHFFNQTPSYAFWNNGSQSPTHIRCLLPFNVTLTGDKEGFSLQDLFAYDKDIQVAGNDARHMLMFSLLTSLYAEGLLNRIDGERPPIFTIFPSSDPTKTDSHFHEFMALVAKSFHGAFIPDLLERHTPALDTSRERYQARQQNRAPNVGVLTHANTVRLNPQQKSKLDNRLIVVLDDFCTTGLSLDWARVLLRQAGVKRLVLAAIGKYKMRHYDMCKPRADLQLDPFSTKQYQSADFAQQAYQLKYEQKAVDDIKAIFDSIVKGQPYPISDL